MRGDAGTEATYTSFRTLSPTEKRAMSRPVPGFPDRILAYRNGVALFAHRVEFHHAVPGRNRIEERHRDLLFRVIRTRPKIREM